MARLPFALTTEQKEARRFHAMELLKDGMRPADVAREVGVTRGAVAHWMRKQRQGGKSALAARPRSGRPKKVSQKNLARLVPILIKGAQASGFETDVWTTQRVAKVIRREFGVKYHPDHVRKILVELGLSWQKPETQARERDEERIRQWVAKDWPRIKKKPREPTP